MNNNLRQKRHNKIRQRVSGTGNRPRACVWRTLNRVAVQLIDDDTGKVIMAVYGKKSKKQNKTEQAQSVGLEVAKAAQAAGIKEVVFDRGGYKYHGRVKAVAQAMREGGLEF